MSSNRFTRSAFTLVELMVSITVLLLTVLIFAQAVGGISSAWRGAEERMNNHNKARALLGRLRTDIDSMVLRPDLAAFPETGEFGFYTLRRGVDGSASTAADARSLSFVNYEFDPDPDNASRLLRWDQGFTYSNSDPLPFGQAPVPPPGGIPNPQTPPDRGAMPTDTSEIALADGVLAFEWAFLRHDGRYSPTLDYVANGKSRTAKGIVVAMLVMDDNALHSLKETGQGDVDELRDALDYRSAVEGEQGDRDWNPKKEWNDQLGLVPGAGAAVAKQYPAQFLRGVRAFERMYLFPTTN